MDWKERVDFGELVRRFDRGDRGADLLAQLNRAAYDCFHAPWETLPAPKSQTPADLPVDLEMGILPPETPSDELNRLRLSQGRLPIEDEDEDQDPPSSPTPRQRRGTYEPVDNPREAPEPETPEARLQNPMRLLVATLETMGHCGYLSGETKLLVEMPYDPKTDSVSWLTFLVDNGKCQILVMCQNDLILGGVSEMELERHCRAYNRRNTGLNAGLFRPQEGARPRLRISAALPFAQVTSQPGLTAQLTRLFRIERQFWNHIRKWMPI